jgi:hypothetical protein
MAGRDSLILKPGEGFQCELGLMPAYGDGIQLRLGMKNTGTLIMPIKVEGAFKIASISL